MSYAAQVADRARADLKRRRETIAKEISSREAEVKEIDAILAGIDTGSKTTPKPKSTTPTSPRKSRAKKTTTRKKQRVAPQPQGVSEDASAAPKKTGRPSHKDRLLRRLGETASGTMDRDDVAKFLDTSEQTVRGLVNDLVRDGSIKITGDNDDKVALA